MNCSIKFIFIFFLFGSMHFRAQNTIQNFSVEKITQDDGLSQGSNYFRFEDSHGFMWITGNDALNRYDGSNVKVYNLNYYFKNCPALQQGYGFAEDHKNLYIGSTRGLYQYDYEKDEFYLIDIYPKNATKTAIPFAFYQGKIWCYNEKYELATYNTTSKKITIEAQLPLEAMLSLHIYGSEGFQFFAKTPFFDKNKNLWFIGKNKILKYEPTTKKISFPFHFKIEKNFYSSDYFQEKNELLVGGDGFFYQLNLNNYHQIQNNLSKITPNIAVSSITHYNNIVALKTIHETILTDIHFSKFIKTLDYPRSFQYAFDKIGRLWFCDDGLGLVVLNFNGKILRNSNENQDSNFNRLKQLGVNNFAELPNGNVLINRFIEHNSKNNFLKNIGNLPEDNISNIRIYYDSLRKGNWAAIDYPNSFKFFFMNNKNFVTEEFKLKSDGSVKFQSMAFFDNSDILLSFTDGIYWYKPLEKKIKKVNAFTGRNSFFINKLSDNRVAISYLNNDMVLAKILPNNQIKILQNILPGVQSFYIQEDFKSKKYWVGSNQGVYLLDKNFKILKKFDSNNGLAGTYIYGILLDNEGNAWCSHQHGLSNINGKTFRIINFDKEDGIQHWDFNNRAFLKTTDGTLYFGGVNGFNFFKPPLTIQSHYLPEIYFDEIFINNKRISTKNGYNAVKKLDLKNNENNLTIKVFIKDLEFGKQRKLYYRITNHENKWRQILAKQPLIFNSLAPDNYKIEFAIYDKFSNKFSNIKNLEININKAFYQTYWFWILISGLFSGGVIFVYSRWKFEQQKNYYRQKLALETQRNKITADLHDDLGATLSSLQINSAIAQNMVNNDQTKTQEILKKIELQAKHISENIGDIVWSMKPGKDEFMSLSTRIRNFANEILGNSEIPFYIEIDKEIDAEITDFTTRKNIVLICKEALNNIAKYSKATEVKLQFKKKDQYYLLEISDNGIGFSQEKIRGNGLHNMKKRTQEMNGNFEIFSEKGTSIKINIPKIRDMP